jgi:hypothetical protein
MYPVGILSLSSETNAHIGTFNTYPTKICCGGNTVRAGSCTIESAKWEVTSTQEGNSVRLNVTGNEAEYCNGLRISFKVLEADVWPLPYDDIVVTQPQDVSFNGATATGQWTAEYGDDGLGGDPEYVFNVSLEIAPNVYLLSTNELSVSETPEDYCLSYGTCSDYQNEGSCESDYCNVAEDDAGAYEVTCDDDTLCGCNWDASSLSCEFNFQEITDCGNPESGCGYGCTLCNNATSGEDYCIAGSTCSGGDEPKPDNDGICEFGEGCLSADCEDGDKDTCNNGLFCSSGRCFSFEDPALWLDQCILNETVISGCEEEPVGYKVIDINGVWTGEQSGSGYETCIAYTEKSKTVSCPAQIELPFFDVIGFVIALMVIAIIYTALIFKKKEHHKKRHKK